MHTEWTDHAYTLHDRFRAALERNSSPKLYTAWRDIMIRRGLIRVV